MATVVSELLSVPFAARDLHCHARMSMGVADRFFPTPNSLGSSIAGSCSSFWAHESLWWASKGGYVPGRACHVGGSTQLGCRPVAAAKGGTFSLCRMPTPLW